VGSTPIRKKNESKQPPGRCLSNSGEISVNRNNPINLLDKMPGMEEQAATV
jgi:hypothetical protein